MRELHVVATSEDGRHVVLATRKGAANGDYRVSLDDRLAAAVRGDLPRPGQESPAGVTPKEIQARLRAGESTEQVAASAGVPVSKIDRYAGPVLAERERVITQARAGFVSRSRLGASSVPLGEAVDRQLAETTGVRLETVTWSARREEAGTWVVQLSYVSQARRRSASWRYDGARREVTALDSASAQLAHVEPGRRPKTADAPVAAPAVRPRKASARSAPGVTKVAARPAPPVRAAAPVPRATAPGRAAQTAADRTATAKSAQERTTRAAAQERTAKAAAAKAQAAAAEQAKQAKADAAGRAKAEAAKKAKADAAKQAKAEAAKQAKAEAAKKAKAEAAKKAKAEAAKRAKAEAAKKAKAEAAKQAKAEAAKKAKAEAAKKAKAEAAKKAKAEAAPAPTGPPTLRVVGAEATPARREPKAPPAAARTAPARVAGQRASVPGWADVLLSTAPVARPDAEPDQD